jgi:hypothetical protein
LVYGGQHSLVSQSWPDNGLSWFYFLEKFNVTFFCFVKNSLLEKRYLLTLSGTLTGKYCMEGLIDAVQLLVKESISKDVKFT